MRSSKFIISNLSILLAACLCLVTAHTLDKEADQKVKELLELQKKSRTGYITLDSAGFDRYAGGKSRPYSLFIIGDARHLRNAKRLNLQGRVDSFAAVSQVFYTTHAGKPTETKAFFARLVFEDSRDTFQRLNVRGLPYLARIPPSLHVRPDAAIKLPEEETYINGASEWTPVDIGGFVTDRCGVSPGDLSAAGAASRSRFLPLFTLMVVAAMGWVGYKLYQSPIMQWTPLYIVGCLVVYWFSVSGGMYNIIRDVPMVGYNSRERKAVMFISGQGQMGAEGFIMGTLYLLSGLTVMACTKVLPSIKDDGTRRTVAYALVLLGFMLYNWVSSTHLWKLHINTFFYF